MRTFLLATLVTLFAVSTVAANPSPRAGQLIDLQVLGGYHAQGSFEFYGKVTFQGATPADGGKTFIFAKDFSTRVTPEGLWRMMVSKRSVLANPPKDVQAKIIEFRAIQDGTNVVVKAKFNLADLNRLLDRKIGFEELWRD